MSVYMMSLYILFVFTHAYTLCLDCDIYHKLITSHYVIEARTGVCVRITTSVCVRILPLEYAS